MDGDKYPIIYKSLAMEEKDPHFKYIFWYISGLTFLIMLFLFAACFLQLHENTVRLVDSTVSNLHYILIALVGFFVGASVQKATTKKSDPGITIPSGEKTTVTTEKVDE